MATDEGSQRIMANGRVALQFYRAQPISFADDPRLFTCSLNVHDIQFIDLRTSRGLLDIIGAEFTPLRCPYVFPYADVTLCGLSSEARRSGRP